MLKVTQTKVKTIISAVRKESEAKAEPKVRSRKELKKEWDVIVVGGGPGGSSAASFLGRKGHSVLLIDKAKFPRDKTCGDAISGSLKVQEELGLQEEIRKNPHAEIHRVLFSAPNGKILDIAFKGIGYCCRRYVYDNIMFEKAKQYSTDLQGFTVTELINENGYVRGVKGKTTEGKEMEFRAKVLVGADGAHSVVAKLTGLLDLDPRHTIIAVRCYYTDVKNVTDAIELHFIDDIIPSYFWIFPLEKNVANVGIGIVMEDFQKKKWKMTDKIFEIIANNPLFKERFQGAKLMEGTVKGWPLPVGSKRRKAHGNGFVLVGDAAGLIDAFTGEGIANAAKSGQIAAEWIDKAIKANDFSERFMSQYEDALWDALGHKLRTSCKLQKMGRRKFLVNLVINKANKSNQIHDTLRLMIDNAEERKGLANPMFYLKLLFA
jgi:geranylgeranyl reductase family protein